MKILLSLTLASLVIGSAPPPKKTPAKKPATASATKKSKTRARTKSQALAGVTGPRNHQAAPTPERYKEIQQALVAKGYLKSEPTGVWDSQSTDALRQFQTDKKLDPSGKLNSPSLIGLGLGPPPPSSAPSQIPAPSVPAPAPQ